MSPTTSWYGQVGDGVVGYVPLKIAVATLCWLEGVHPSLWRESAAHGQGVQPHVCSHVYEKSFTGACFDAPGKATIVAVPEVFPAPKGKVRR